MNIAGTRLNKRLAFLVLIVTFVSLTIFTGDQNYSIVMASDWNHGTGNTVNAVALSADGRYMVAGNDDHEILFFNTSHSNPLWSYSAGGEVESVAISANGSYIVAGSTDNSVYCFSFDSNIPVWSYETSGWVTSVAISDNGSAIIAGSDDNNVYLFTPLNSTPVWIYNAPSDVRLVSISSDGEWILAANLISGEVGTNAHVYLFNVDDPSPVDIREDYHDINSFSLSTDGSYIAIGTDQGVYLYTRSNPTAIWSNKNIESVAELALSGDSKYLIVGGDWLTRGSVYLFQRTSSEYTWRYEIADSPVTSIAISQDGKFSIAGDAKGRLHFFNNSVSTPLWSHSTGSQINDVAISLNGSICAAVNVAGNITALTGYSPVEPDGTHIDQLIRQLALLLMIVAFAVLIFSIAAEKLSPSRFEQKPEKIEKQEERIFEPRLSDEENTKRMRKLGYRTVGSRTPASRLTDKKVLDLKTIGKPLQVPKEMNRQELLQQKHKASKQKLSKIDSFIKTHSLKMNQIKDAIATTADLDKLDKIGNDAKTARTSIRSKTLPSLGEVSPADRKRRKNLSIELKNLARKFDDLLDKIDDKKQQVQLEQGKLEELQRQKYRDSKKKLDFIASLIEKGTDAVNDTTRSIDNAKVDQAFLDGVTANIMDMKASILAVTVPAPENVSPSDRERHRALEKNLSDLIRELDGLLNRIDSIGEQFQLEILQKLERGSVPEEPAEEPDNLLDTAGTSASSGVTAATDEQAEIAGEELASVTVTTPKVIVVIDGPNSLGRDYIDRLDLEDVRDHARNLDVDAELVYWTKASDLDRIDKEWIERLGYDIRVKFTKEEDIDLALQEDVRKQLKMVDPPNTVILGAKDRSYSKFIKDIRETHGVKVILAISSGEDLSGDLARRVKEKEYFPELFTVEIVELTEQGTYLGIHTETRRSKLGKKVFITADRTLRIGEKVAVKLTGEAPKNDFARLYVK